MNTNERDKQQPVGDGGGRKFNLGEPVTKTKGSSWTGYVVGFYSTKLTPVGYAVESINEPGSVQIYPEAALATQQPVGDATFAGMKVIVDDSLPPDGFELRTNTPPAAVEGLAPRLATLEVAYLALLSRHDVWRLHNQNIYCLLRDAIAAATGRSEQEIQDEYEAKALATAKQGERVQGVEVTDEMAAKVLSDYMCEIHGCVAFAPNRASIDAMRQAMKRALIDSTSAQGIENLPSPERGRYFAHGPIGYFFTDDLQLATAILVAYDKDDDWTVTDLHNPYGIDSASGAGEVERG